MQMERAKHVVNINKLDMENISIPAALLHLPLSPEFLFHALHACTDSHASTGCGGGGKEGKTPHTVSGPLSVVHDEMPAERDTLYE